MNLVDLDALQSVRTYPCVSVLLSTDPGPVLAPRDRERLGALVDHAARRLRAELPPSEVDPLVSRLALLAESVSRQPARASLALFVNEHMAWSTSLLVPVRDRVVVDDTFATRDLVDHVNRTDPYWLLTVSERSARLFLGNIDRLVPLDDPFPVSNAPGERDDRPRPLTDHLRRVAEALDDALDGDHVPLVLAGVDTTVAAFQRASGRRPVGRLAGNHDHTSITDLHRLSRPIIERVIAARQSLAMGELDKARDQRRFAGGLPEVWSLAQDGRVSLVVAERTFEAPARLGERPGEVVPASDREHPEVIDDLVDELVEVVLAKGGRAVFVDDGRLAMHGRVAAALRY